MPVLKSRLNTKSKEYQENFLYHKGLANELKERLAQVQRGGPEKAVRLHQKRNKLLARERITRLIDSDSPFMELSPLESYNVLQKGGGHYGRKGHYQDEFRRAKEDKYNKSSYGGINNTNESCREDRNI